jgi:hypothetical protein
MNRCFRIATLVFILVNFLIPSIPASAADAYSIDIPIQSLNSDQPINLSGLISTQTIEIPIPTNWEIAAQSWLEIGITASEILDLPNASLTISLNGLQVKSFHLSNMSGTTQRIELPANFFKRGNNTLTFTGTLYLPDDMETNCKIWDDPARWVLIDPLSKLHLSVQKKVIPADLSHFTDFFLRPLDQYLPEDENQTLFILPDGTKQDDLNAMSVISYFLGYEAGENFSWNPQILTESEFNQLNNINGNLIFIDIIPPQFKENISIEKDAVGMFTSPWDSSKAVLVISDQNREDGYSPAYIFGDSSRKALLIGNVAYLDRTVLNPPPNFKDKYSFEELGYLDRTVRGIGRDNLTYRIYIPHDIDPTSATLSLQLAHSPDLDIQTSSFSIYLNGLTVASILPTAKKTGTAPIRVDLPINRFRPGINFLRFSFDLHLPYSSCEKALETVWATIFNNTTLQMTYRERISNPSLEDFPMPFNAPPGVSFIIPTEQDGAALAHIAQLTFSIGASSFYPTQPPEILTENNYGSAKTKQTNFILVGLPSENSAIKEVNDFMPQPFAKDWNQLQEGFGVFLPTYDQNASSGLLQIIPSPWSKNGTILVLTGTDSQGISWAWDIILDSKIRDQFSGNLMIVGSEKRSASPVAQEDQVLAPYFQQTPILIYIPIVGKFLQTNGQSEPYLALIAILMAGLAILIGLKVASTLSKYEIRPKHSPLAEKEERE